MKKCPNCGQPTLRTRDWACRWCGYPLLSGSYRETPKKIAMRRAEGCLAVEMEAAALMAVAQFRKVPFGQVLYAGDDLSGNQWDKRDWQSRLDVRENLFWLAVDAVLSMS